MPSVSRALVVALVIVSSLAALNAVNGGDRASAGNKLDAFTNEVRAQSGKRPRRSRRPN